MRLAEIHSSELTDSCLRKVYHRLNGEISGETTTALYRGLVAGRAVELLHQEEFKSDPSEITIAASAYAQKSLAEENRTLTDAVEHNRGDILAEITNAIHLYRDRFGPMFDQCSLLGTELPCRMKLDGVDYASHLDLLVRDTNNVFGYGGNRLIVFDWKWRESAPSYQYLARNMQFALYYLMVKQGTILVYPQAGDMGWVEFNEPSTLVWFHLPHLKPYSRRQVSKNDRGEEQEYSRGDERPLRTILYPVNYDEKQSARIETELKLRANMVENDIFPLNPNPVSCRICDAEAFCTRFDMPQI